jgi:hypothetical protein
MTDRASDAPAPRAPATDGDHRRPDHVDGALVEAVGKVSEAFEWIERARGRLYDFHHLIGRADLLMGEAADLLAECGVDELGELVRDDVVGRNVLDGRWTFQVVEEFDAGYYGVARDVEARVRNDLMGGRRHVFEAELKEQRRTPGRPGHEPRPPHR